ncbi:hypothetical protein M0804_007715 [Polistes exclamans]|nr:hypothetical protein M0804_007715 [Polistes exclamans]
MLASYEWVKEEEEEEEEEEDKWKGDRLGRAEGRANDDVEENDRVQDSESSSSIYPTFRNNSLVGKSAHKVVLRRTVASEAESNAGIY